MLRGVRGHTDVAGVIGVWVFVGKPPKHPVDEGVENLWVSGPKPGDNQPLELAFTSTLHRTPDFIHIRTHRPKRFHPHISPQAKPRHNNEK